MTSDWVELALNLKLTDSQTVSLGIRSNDGERISYLFPPPLNCTFFSGLRIFSHLYLKKFFFFSGNSFLVHIS